MTTFLMFQPFFLLSGFAFPIRNMPVAVQYLTYLDPVRYFTEIVRGLFLRGVGIRGALAADGSAGGVRDGDLEPQRSAVPEAAGLRAGNRSLTVAARKGVTEPPSTSFLRARRRVRCRPAPASPDSKARLDTSLTPR